MLSEQFVAFAQLGAEWVQLDEPVLVEDRTPAELEALERTYKRLAAVHDAPKILMARPVYLDYHATTPVDPKVLDAMLPYFTQQFGNAASKQHAFGWEAQDAVERARRQVATLIGADYIPWK